MVGLGWVRLVMVSFGLVWRGMAGLALSSRRKLRYFIIVI